MWLAMYGRSLSLDIVCKCVMDWAKAILKSNPWD